MPLPYCRAVAAGVNDTWVSDTNLETLAVVKIKTTYVLKDITDKNYVIHGDAMLTSAGTADFVQSNGMPMRYNNMSGTLHVDIKLDKATGWITDSKDYQEYQRRPGNQRQPAGSWWNNLSDDHHRRYQYGE